MDGLSIFIDQTWDKIKNQKELNLPDQRSMVANFRCNELKEEALENVKGPISELKSECDRGLVADFELKCREIIKISTTHYDEFAHQYEQAVYHKIKKELAAAVVQILFLCFDSQLKMQRQKIFEKFDKDLRRSSQKDLVSDSFHQDT